MLGWRSYVRERERRLAAEGAPLKFAGAASVGLEYLDPGGADDDLPGLLARVSAALGDADAFFAGSERPSFRRQGAMLTFDSPSAGDGPNSIARGVYRRAPHDSGADSVEMELRDLTCKSPTTRRNKINRRNILALSAIAALGLPPSAGGAAKTLKARQNIGFQL